MPRLPRDLRLKFAPHSQSDRRRRAGLVAVSRIGGTVADLAKRIGYSEREAYRRLRHLYSRIRASSRTDALLRVAPLESSGLIGARHNGWTQYAFEHQPAQEYPHRNLPGTLTPRALGVRRRHGEANPDALAESEALPRTVVTADGSTVREESAESPREGAN